MMIHYYFVKFADSIIESPGESSSSYIIYVEQGIISTICKRIQPMGRNLDIPLDQGRTHIFTIVSSKTCHNVKKCQSTT